MYNLIYGPFSLGKMVGMYKKSNHLKDYYKADSEGKPLRKWTKKEVVRAVSVLLYPDTFSAYLISKRSKRFLLTTCLRPTLNGKNNYVLDTDYIENQLKNYVAYDGTFYVHRFEEGEEHSARCFWSAKEAQNLCRKINREAKIKEEL